MTTVSATRTLSAPPTAVRSAIVERPREFVAAAGFDEVRADGDTFSVARELGLATIELTVRLDRDAAAALAFEAVEGIFDHMRTEYVVTATEGGSRVTAETTFSLGGIAGAALDATLVARQRRREFEDQFDYLAATLAPSGEDLDR
ncbi:MAG: SRPBCC family protein [Halanaeroarchaeum sp.]